MEKQTVHAHHAEFIDDSPPLDLDDPHRAALENNPEHAEKLTLQVGLAVASLAFAFVLPISCGFVLITGILVQVGTDLGDTANITWIVGGWSIASSVSFSIAGSLSDVFGRRWTIISGEIIAIIGAVSLFRTFLSGQRLTDPQIVSATAQSTLTVAAGSTIIGFGCGIIFVAYAGISELVPNKWR